MADECVGEVKNEVVDNLVFDYGDSDEYDDRPASPWSPSVAETSIPSMTSIPCNISQKLVPVPYSKTFLAPLSPLSEEDESPSTLDQSPTTKQSSKLVTSPEQLIDLEVEEETQCPSLSVPAPTPTPKPTATLRRCRRAHCEKHRYRKQLCRYHYYKWYYSMPPTMVPRRVPRRKVTLAK